MLLKALYVLPARVPGPAGGGLDAHVAAAVFDRQQTVHSKQSTELETFANKSELPSLTYIQAYCDIVGLIMKSVSTDGLVPSMFPGAQHNYMPGRYAVLCPARARLLVRGWGLGTRLAAAREAPDEIAHARFDHFMVSSVFLHNRAQNISRELDILCHRSCSCSLVSQASHVFVQHSY